jgi:hypothetical protein
MRLSSAIVEVLQAHAERRGVTVNALARRILTLVAQAELVDAVLDDGERK